MNFNVALNIPQKSPETVSGGDLPWKLKASLFGRKKVNCLQDIEKCHILKARIHVEFALHNLHFIDYYIASWIVIFSLQIRPHFGPFSLKLQVRIRRWSAANLMVVIFKSSLEHHSKKKQETSMCRLQLYRFQPWLSEG